MDKKPKKRRGITLVELLVSIGILGIVTGVVCECLSKKD